MDENGVLILKGDCQQDVTLTMRKIQEIVYMMVLVCYDGSQYNDIFI